MCFICFCKLLVRTSPHTSLLLDEQNCLKWKKFCILLNACYINSHPKSRLYTILCVKLIFFCYFRQLCQCPSLCKHHLFLLLLLLLVEHMKELDPAGPDLVAGEKPTDEELEPDQKADEQTHRSPQQLCHVHLNTSNETRCSIPHRRYPIPANQPTYSLPRYIRLGWG